MPFCRNTIQLGEELQSAFELITGKRPHLIVVHLHRRKLDVNRPLLEATFGDAGAMEAWGEYHDAIELAKSSIDGPGLLLDVHAHARNNTELGYRISKRRMDADNYYGRTRRKSSICALVKRVCGEADEPRGCFRELVRGEASLGERLLSKIDLYAENDLTLLADHDVLPSIELPMRETDYDFSAEGYTVLRHGTRTCRRRRGHVDAVQLQVPRDVLNDDAKRQVYALSLAYAVVDFLYDFYYPY